MSPLNKDDSENLSEGTTKRIEPEKLFAPQGGVPIPPRSEPEEIIAESHVTPNAAPSLEEKPTGASPSPPSPAEGRTLRDYLQDRRIIIALIAALTVIVVACICACMALGITWFLTR